MNTNKHTFIQINSCNKEFKTSKQKSQTSCPRSVIEAFDRLSQEDQLHSEFQTSLGDIRPYFQINTRAHMFCTTHLL